MTNYDNFNFEKIRNLFGGIMLHICTIRCYKLFKNSKRSDWSIQIGSEGRNGKPRAGALRQCVGCWVCDACNAFNQVHECTLTPNIFKFREIFPVTKTSLSLVKHMHIWLPSIVYSPTKIYTHLIIGILRIGLVMQTVFLFFGLHWRSFW